MKKYRESLGEVWPFTGCSGPLTVADQEEHDSPTDGVSPCQVNECSSRMCELGTEGCPEKATPGVRACPATKADFPYDRTFRAIAAATKIEGAGIGISVKAFIEAWNAYIK